LKPFDELALCNGSEVQTESNPVLFEVAKDCGFEARIIMSVIQRARPAKKVDVRPILLVDEKRTYRTGEDDWKGSTIGSNVGLILIEDLHRKPSHARFFGSLLIYVATFVRRRRKVCLSRD